MRVPEKPLSVKCAIPECPNLARQPETGRPGKYCSNRCRARGFRRKQRSDTTKHDATKHPDILFYCGINENTWNHHPVAPGEYACIAPVYGKTKRTKVLNSVDVPLGTQVIIDSSAFSDTIDLRLSFEQALHRQVAHAYRFGYVRQVSHIASYDVLIDEKWQDGERSKIRWAKDEAEWAISETVRAATYVARHRRAISRIFGHSVGLILSAQGVEVEQYLRCVQQIVPMMEENDVCGLGGFCITGVMPEAILPSFRAIIQAVIPYLGSQRVKRVHIWGVCFAEALGELLWLCDQYGIMLSTDSSGPQRRPIMGEWGYASWRDNAYKVPPILESCKAINAAGEKAPTCPPHTRCRGLERSRHVQLTRQWLANLREREAALYRPIPLGELRQTVGSLRMEGHVRKERGSGYGQTDQKVAGTH